MHELLYLIHEASESLIHAAAIAALSSSQHQRSPSLPRLCRVVHHLKTICMICQTPPVYFSSPRSDALEYVQQALTARLRMHMYCQTLTLRAPAEHSDTALECSVELASMHRD